jgi:hypothetical protein
MRVRLRLRLGVALANENRGHGRDALGVGGVDPGAQCRVPSRPFAHGEVQPAIELRGIEEAAEEVADGFGDVARQAGALVRDAGGVARAPFLEQRRQQVRPVPEIPVEARPGDAHSPGQGQDLHLSDPVAHQHVSREVQPVLAAYLRVGRDRRATGVAAGRPGRGGRGAGRPVMGGLFGPRAAFGNPRSRCTGRCGRPIAVIPGGRAYPPA